MRTTIDLPGDLHQIATSIAAHTRRSLSQTLAELVRRGLEAPADAQHAVAAGQRKSSLTGLPLIRSARPVTPEDVRALEDE